jgi:hypothetical protein
MMGSIFVSYRKKIKKKMSVWVKKCVQKPGNTMFVKVCSVLFVKREVPFSERRILQRNYGKIEKKRIGFDAG